MVMIMIMIMIIICIIINLATLRFLCDFICFPLDFTLIYCVPNQRRPGQPHDDSAQAEDATVDAANDGSAVVPGDSFQLSSNMNCTLFRLPLGWAVIVTCKALLLDLTSKPSPPFHVSMPTALQELECCSKGRWRPNNKDMKTHLICKAKLPRYCNRFRYKKRS